MKDFVLQNYSNQLSTKGIRSILAKYRLPDVDITRITDVNFELFEDYCNLTPISTSEPLDMSTTLRTLFTSDSKLHDILFCEYLCCIANSNYYGRSLFNTTLSGTNMTKVHKELCNAEAFVHKKMMAGEFDFRKMFKWKKLYQKYKENVTEEYLTYSYLHPDKKYPFVVCMFDLVYLAFEPSGYLNGILSSYPLLTAYHTASQFISKPSKKHVTEILSLCDSCLYPEIKFNEYTISRSDFHKLKIYSKYFHCLTSFILDSDKKTVYSKLNSELNIKCEELIRRYRDHLLMISVTTGIEYNISKRILEVIDSLDEYTSKCNTFTFTHCIVPFIAQTISRNKTTNGECTFSNKIGKIKFCSVYPHILSDD